MAKRAHDNQNRMLEDLVQQFVDAQLQGQQPDIDEFVKRSPELEDQIRKRIGKLNKLDTLFSSLVRLDEHDSDAAATGPDLAGQKIGSFEIGEKIGQGGMGVVYLARDTKLDRSVAIKKMPTELLANATARMRFKREATLLASLNHPNIAVIHDIIEQDDSSSYLVLEYIPGQTLTERIAHTPLKLEDALFVGRQIAEALEAAHEKGIVHRDLKPENIKISSDGHVKILDFGLAKEVMDRSESNDPVDSSTTLPGELVGTAPYMSPEQASARPIDKRSDIWSFGCVLFECLTGKRVFQAEGVTETLASILTEEPDWAALPENTPPTIQLLLRKCLNKDPRRRLHDIADARIDLEQALADPTSSIIRLSGQALQETTVGSGHPWWLTTGIVVFACLVMAIVVWSLKPYPPGPPIRRISMDLGMEGRLATGHVMAVRFSPDGSTLAFRAGSKEGTEPAQIYLRRLDQLDAAVIPNTRGASQFCFSPDGRSIAFRDATENTLKRVATTGGATTTLCKLETDQGLDWADDDFVFFAGQTSTGLLRVSSVEGGAPEPVTTAPDDGSKHRWPQILPGGQAVLFSAYYHGAKANVMVQRLPQGEAEQIWQGGHDARYLSSGHVVFISDGTLYGAAFDLDTLTLAGRPMPLVEEVRFKPGAGMGDFDVSQEGSLVYVKSASKALLRKVGWVDREGKHQTLLPADYYGPLRLSPKGEYLAYGLSDGRQIATWIYDFERSVPSRFTFSSSGEYGPVWSPSGESIVFSRMDNGVSNLYWKRANGNSEAQRLIVSQNTQIPDSWHPSGDRLVIFEGTNSTASNLRILALEGDEQSGWIAGEITDFRADAFSERMSRISPDGRWIAYVSNERGENQVYVRSFPNGGGMKQVSLPGTSNGMPIWSRNGSELIFGTHLEGSASNSWQVFIVAYSLEGDAFIPERPVPWKGAIYDGGYGGIDLHPDGKRLLVRSLADGEVSPIYDRVVLFENFIDYLREQMPRD
jgi:serine/threonine protein kinase/Tol biopolymer transport system component